MTFIFISFNYSIVKEYLFIMKDLENIRKVERPPETLSQSYQNERIIR
jgi:hypothetical protein